MDLPLPPDSKWWGQPTIRGWVAISGVEISEAGGLQLAQIAGDHA